MARLKIHVDRLIENIQKISGLMQEHDKQWSLVVKVLGTDKNVLTQILSHPVIRTTHSIAVSQWKSLKIVKDIDPTLRTMFIKPPAVSNAAQIVRYADVSFNSSLLTIQALSREAVKQDKVH